MQYIYVATVFQERLEAAARAWCTPKEPPGMMVTGNGSSSLEGNGTTKI